MKKLLALLLACMLLLLAACGKTEPQTEPSEQLKTETVATSEDETAATEAPTVSDELFVKETVMEDGTKVTTYRLGGPEGTPVRGIMEYPDGAYYEEVYEDGILVSTKSIEADGTLFETTFYPSGTIATDRMTYPDGSMEEYHYLDNGSVDPETGWIHSGTITYEKRVSADGTVEEFDYNIQLEKDGTYWMTQEYDDGSISRTHYSADNVALESTLENPAEGWTIVDTFYPSGARHTSTKTYENSDEYGYSEQYENGLTKYEQHITSDGIKMESKYNEEGLHTYHYSKDIYGEYEYFANEAGELEKLVANGTVYEGDKIPENNRNLFKQMQEMAAEVAYNILNGI